MSAKSLPDCIGKYRVKKVLGKGAMGVVYLGLDEVMQRHVAIKVLHTHLAEDEDSGPALIQRFHHEAQASARCLHPNIVSVFDCGFHDRLPFIVMEYVEGVELRAQLLLGDQYSLAVATDITIQVLRALDHAHGKNIVHRDIKPANIILLKSGEVKVSDFGVARLDTSNLTGTGFMVGTPNYMSPEALGGQAVDQRADLYSVGVLFFELLTARLPMRGVSVEESLRALDEQPHLSQQNLHSIKPILNKALHPVAEARFQSATAFIESLEKIDDLTLTEAKSAFFISPKALTLVQAPCSTQSVSHWSDEILSVVEQSLAKYLGPMAHYLVKKSCRSAHSLEGLSKTLAEHIPQDAEKRAFLRELNDSGILLAYESHPPQHSPTTPPPAAGHGDTVFRPRQRALSDAEIQRVAEALIYFIGPIATRVAKHAAKSANSVEEFHRLAANSIPNETERQSFLRRFLTP